MFENHETPVRCGRGHLFTTIWVPLVSVKAIRLGPHHRYGRCPVGHHWSGLRRLDAAELTPRERDDAAAVHDLRVP